MVYIHMILYYSVVKKEWSIDLCLNMNEPWKHYAKWKNTETRLYNFMYSKCLKQVNPAKE